MRTGQGESDTRQKVRALDKKGRTPREIALLLGLSTQRVYQHLKEIRAADEREAM